MHLDGQEPGINGNAAARGIYIHGTPPSNYSKLGDSASHGCVRMHNTTVVTVFNAVKRNHNGGVGTRVFINSKAIPAGSNPCDLTGFEDPVANGKAR
jgi:hypothetical protein